VYAATLCATSVCIFVYLEVTISVRHTTTRYNEERNMIDRPTQTVSLNLQRIGLAYLHA